jgi:glycine cleavage system transcriptional repressor
MKKFIISVLGQDRPGIIAAVSEVFSRQDYNIEEVSQTILQNQFSCFFVVTGPEDASPGQLVEALKNGTSPFALLFHARELDEDAPAMRPEDYEPFVVTTRGPDRKGLIAGITSVFAEHGVNVAQLRAVLRPGDDKLGNTMIYEVDVPVQTDQKELRDALCLKAGELGQEISIQHRNIFETMNRVM